MLDSGYHGQGTRILSAQDQPEPPTRLLMSKTRLLSAVAAAVLIHSVPAFAQAQSQSSAPTGGGELDTIEVTGERGSSSLTPLSGQFPKPETPHQITQSLTVVDRGQIEQSSPTGLLDVLATVPGVSIARSGGIGGQIYLRGFSSNNFRSPMFVDGDRFRGRNTLQLNYFSPEEVERVEVIRGPASVLYGSEALTGLVNIITRSPTGDPNGPFRFTGGGFSAGFGSAAKSFSTYDWIQGAGGGFDFLGAVSGRWGNDYRTGDGVAPNSDYRSLGGSLKIGYSPDASQRIELTVRKYHEVDGRAGGVGGAPGVPFLIVRQDPNEVTSVRLSYKGEFDSGLFRRVEASVYANYFDTTLLTENNTVRSRTVLQSSHVVGPWVVGGRAMGVIPWAGPWGQVVTTVGVDGFNEARPGSEQWSRTINRNATGGITSITNTPLTQSGPDSTQSNVGVFMLHEWTPFEALTISAGGRFDYFNTTTELWPVAASVLPAYRANADVDTTAPTGSVGLVYRIHPMLDLVASVSTSFRQPTNSEMFSSTATSIPNAGLQPERGVTYEGGFRFHVANATVKVTAYNSNYDNLLALTQVSYNGSPAFTQTQNVGRAEVNGVEIEERWQVTPTLNIFGSAAYMEGTNLTTGRPLPYIAPFRGRIGVQYAAADRSYAITGVVDWAAGKSRIDPTQEFATGGYAIPKIYATLDLGKLVSSQLGDTKLIVGLENIFDTAYRDASTFANVSYPETLTNPLVEMGRNFTVKLQHTF